MNPATRILPTVFLLFIWSLSAYAQDQPQIRSSSVEVSAGERGRVGEIRHAELMNGAVALAGTAESGFVRSRSIELPAVDGDPFLALGSRWEMLSGESNQAILSIRTSADGSTWDNWMAVSADPHVVLEGEYLAGELVFLPRESRFLQYRLELSSHGFSDVHEHSPDNRRTDRPVIGQIQFTFIHPGATPASMQETIESRRPVQETLEQRIRTFGTADVFEGFGRQTEAAPAQPTQPNFPFVTRTEWGSPDGQGSRGSIVLTNPTHLFVHHSATANTAADWAAVVRSFWSYHTETLGWGDIGYNWLVDRDGVIYQGRAWHNDENPDVRGTHVAARNTNLMGLCIIGNFNNTMPPELAIAQARRVLAWKAEDRAIDPRGQSVHVSGDLYRNISGHRDAGTTVTDCPGHQLHAYLPTLRERVYAFMHPPLVETLPVTDSTPTSAVLAATLNSRDTPVSYFFEWGTSPEMPNRTPDRDADAGTADLLVTEQITGLLPNIPIYYRLIAANSDTLTVGDTQTFTPTFYELDEVVWRIRADEVPWFRTENTERGLAFNPVTGNLLAVTRADGLQVIILDAETGSFAGTLNTSGIAGGTFPLNLIDVTRDGQIFAANLTLDSEDDALRIYRWTNEASAPEVAFSGSVDDGRYGDFFGVAGTGQDAQVFVGGSGHNRLAYLVRNGAGLELGRTIDMPASLGTGSVAEIPESGEIWVNARGMSPMRIRLATGEVRQTIPAEELDPAFSSIDHFDFYGLKLLAVGPKGTTMGEQFMQFVDVTDPEQAITFGETMSIGVSGNPNATGAVAFDTHRNRAVLLATNSGIAAFDIDLMLPQPVAYEAQLAGLNEVPPVVTPAGGSVDAVLRGNELTLSGEFTGLTHAFTAAHIHQAGPGDNGPVIIPLNADVGDDVRGVFDVEPNTFTLSDEHITALTGGLLYVNVHSDGYPAGEIRGQLLPAPNEPPVAVASESPDHGTAVSLEGPFLADISFAWDQSPTAEEKRVVYLWQLSTDSEFDNLLININTGTERTYALTYGRLDSLVADAGLPIRDVSTLYHRVIASDGSHLGAGVPTELTVTRGLVTLPMTAATALPHGTEAAVEGIVTRALGTRARLQDGDGGVTVLEEAGDFNEAVASADVHRGDYIRIRGRVIREEGEATRLEDIGHFEVVRRDEPVPVPEPITLAELLENADTHVSRVVRVENLVLDRSGDAVYTSGPDGNTYALTDGTADPGAVDLYIPPPGDTELIGRTIPHERVAFEGVVDLADGNYRLTAVRGRDVSIFYESIAWEEHDPLPDDKGRIWTFDQRFETIPGAHGVVIDRLNRVWLGGTSGNNVGLYVLDHDGNRAPFSPISSVSVDGQEIDTQSNVLGFARDRDEQILAVVNEQDLVRIDADTGGGLNHWRADAPIARPAVSDERIFVSHREPREDQEFQEIIVLDFETLQPLDTIQAGPAHITYALAAVADGTVVFSGDGEREGAGILYRYLYDPITDSYNVRDRATMFEGGVTSLDWSPDSLLWVGDEGLQPAHVQQSTRNLKVFDLQNESFWTFRHSDLRNFPRGVGFSVSGDTLYTVSHQTSWIQRFTLSVPIGTEPITELPQVFTLHGNYPNPFNPSTNIRFDLPEAAEVSIRVFDVLGRSVMTIGPQHLSAGAGQTIRIDASTLASGVYLYRIEARNERREWINTGRMTFVK